LEENLSSKAKEVDQQNKTLSTVISKLQDSNRQLVELQKQYKDQQIMLGSATEKNKDYKKLLADTQSGASNEKEQFLMEQKYKEQEFQQRIEKIKELMQKESSENIRNLTESHQKELSERISKHNLVIEKMRLESEQMRQHKENEILLLQNNLKMLSEKQDRNRESLSSQHLTHQQEITDLKKAFEQQKEEMLNDFERQLSTLKDTSVEEMTRKEDGWHEMMKQEMSTISADHQRELEELHKANQLLLTSLKSQLVAEQEAENEELKRNFAIEKEKLQNVLQIQHEERLKQITKDFEKEITTQKDELSTSKDLRQKEFDVHAKKISELTQQMSELEIQSQQLQNSLSNKESEVTAIRKELESKVEEILSIRRECNSRMRCREEELTEDHQKTLQTLRHNHVNELRHQNDDWTQEKCKLQEEVDALSFMLKETEEKFRQRPSRDEDVLYINQLQEKLTKQELICQKLNDEKKYYKLELVNREENFNKVFSNSPKVGFMNPVELSRKKSSRKR